MGKISRYLASIIAAIPALFSLFHFIFILTFSSLLGRLFLLPFSRQPDRLLEKIGASLVSFLPRAGPAFVKLGQLLSSRPDLVNPVICQYLCTLRDKVPPIPLSKLDKLLRKELGPRLAQLNIEPLPIASASLAQVHRATILQPENLSPPKIALKILRPQIGRKFFNNLALLNFIAGLATLLFPSTKRLKLKEAIAVITNAAQIELNMHLEAAAANKLKTQQLKSPNNSVYIPEVIWDYSTKQILALEWVEGTPIYQTSVLEAQGHNLPALAKDLVTCFFDQACNHGFFHADLHPGNILVTPGGQVNLIDFGLVGFLPLRDKFFITQIFYYFLKRDYEQVALLHRQAGYLPSSASLELFALTCRSIAEPLMNRPTGEISMQTLLTRLFAVTAQFNMETQPNLLLLQKNLLCLEGTLHSLHPHINLWQIARPWLEEWASKNMGLWGKLQYWPVFKQEFENSCLSFINKIINSNQ